VWGININLYIGWGSAWGMYIKSHMCVEGEVDVQIFLPVFIYGPKQRGFFMTHVHIG